MYPITPTVKALFDSEQRKVLRITGTDFNGNAITITEANVAQGGFNIDRYSCNGKMLEIGTAVASELTLGIDNRQGQFDNIRFEGAELFVEVGVADWSSASPTVYYIPMGYFTSDEQPRRIATITLHALDRMTRLDRSHPYVAPWTNEDGITITAENDDVIDFTAYIDFPATVESIVTQLCTLSAIPIAQDISSLPNAQLVFDAPPALQQSYTFRNMLQWCAGLMGTNAWIDWNGEMRFSWYDNSTNYSLTVANRLSSDLYENDVVVTGFKYESTGEEKTVYVAGSEDYALSLSGNGFMTDDIASSVLTNLYIAHHHFAYRPFSASVICAPYLWPMDRVTFIDKNGTGHVTLLTNVNCTLNGLTNLAASGESAQSAGAASPGSFTPEQASVLENIHNVTGSAIENAVESATAMITGADGGYVRFIYDSNDVLSEIVIMDTDDITTATKVWRWNSGGLGYSANGYGGPYTLAMTQNGAIVADFITTGVLNALLVDVINLNASNITAGTMTANHISGGTLTLGGQNNVNGVLKVLDASGTQIGIWNRNGIEASFCKLQGDLETISDRYKTLISGGKINVYYNSTLCGFLQGISRVVGNEIWLGINENDIASALTLGCYNSGTGPQIMVYQGSDSGRYGYVTISSGYINRHEALITLDNDDNNAGAIYYNADDGHTFQYGDVAINNDLWVGGSKSRKVSTDQFSDRLLYCYETSSPMFGDVGEGRIADDGKCYVWFDAIFAQTISITQYQVFLQNYGNGTCWVSERKNGYFCVEGTPGLSFGWEVKAKQKGYEQKRLDKAIKRRTLRSTDYGYEAASYIDDLKKERMGTK